METLEAFGQGFFGRKSEDQVRRCLRNRRLWGPSSTWSLRLKGRASMTPNVGIVDPTPLTVSPRKQLRQFC